MPRENSVSEKCWERECYNTFLKSLGTTRFQFISPQKIYRPPPLTAKHSVSHELNNYFASLIEENTKLTSNGQ